MKHDKEIERLIEESKQEDAPAERRLLAALYHGQQSTNRLLWLLIEIMKKS